MASEYNRYFFGKCQAQTQITGDASENAVIGSKFVLPFKATLEAARFSSYDVAADKTALINVYADSTEVVDQATLNSTTLSAKGALIAAKKDKIWPSGTVFSMKEECTASSNVNGLSVDLCFVQIGVPD